VHLVAAIPPKIAVAKFIGQLKGAASTRFNKSGIREGPIFWQHGYGVFSFDRKRLPNYIAYVERQKEHHRQDTVIPILERSTDALNRTARESETLYGFEDGHWRAELEALGTP